MEKRHFSEDAEGLEDRKLLLGARFRLLHDLAASFEDDPDVLNRLAFRENHLAGRVGLGFEHAQQLLSLVNAHAAKQRTFRQGGIGNAGEHQMPPKTVARPTRPIPMMYAAVRSDTCLSRAMFQTRSKLSTITRSNSLRTRARSQLKCWRFWTHSK